MILYIIAAGYLDNSDYTVKRIANKINNYLAIINHSEFIEDFGLPSPDRTNIELVCNVEPHPEIYELIESLKGPVHSYNASISLVVKG